MRAFILLLSVALCLAAKRGIVTLHGSLDSLNINAGGACPEYTNVIDGYREAMNNFTVETYKRVALRGTYQFVMSPHSMWLTLAAIAEGADYYNQHQLFQLLLLPSNPCARQKYYQLAASRFSFTSDATVVSKRALIIDQGMTPNPVWHNFVARNSLIEVMSAPIKFNPAVAASRIRQVVYANFPQLDLRGNSVLLDTVDYNGLKNIAFTDAVVKRAPFYSLSGEIIGTVDLMRLKRRGKIGYVASLQAKILQLPIGVNNRYSMVIALAVGNVDLGPIIQDMKSSVFSEVVASLRETHVPIDIALPQFTLNSEIDAKTILEDLGVTNIWTDPQATRYISDPPAWPSSYVQRASLTLNKDAVNPPPIPELLSFGPPTTPEEPLWSEFIADRPFMFGLVDTETYTSLMTAMYTQPTYPN